MSSNGAGGSPSEGSDFPVSGRLAVRRGSLPTSWLFYGRGLLERDDRGPVSLLRSDPVEVALPSPEPEHAESGPDRGGTPPVEEVGVVEVRVHDRPRRPLQGGDG